MHNIITRQSCFKAVGYLMETDGTCYQALKQELMPDCPPLIISALRLHVPANNFHNMLIYIKISLFYNRGERDKKRGPVTRSR